MKEEEKQFFKTICEKCSNHGLSEQENNNRVFPRDVINSAGFPTNQKRAWYFLRKWSSGRKDLYSYGVSLDLGWITPKGNEYYNLIVTQITPQT